jgi:hypothetical protein
LWNNQPRQKPRRKVPNRTADYSDLSEDEIKIGPFPPVTSDAQANSDVHITPRPQDLSIPGKLLFISDRYCESSDFA